MRLRGIPLLAASVALLSLAGCTAGPSTRPEIVVNDGPAPREAPTSAAKVPVPPLEEPRQAFRAWDDCPATVAEGLVPLSLPAWLQVQCAGLMVTLDSPYAPGRGRLRVQLLRAGTGPIPLVVVNDAGGQPGTVYAAQLAASLPQDFFTRFSLVGMDRRGTGNSDSPTCVQPDTRAAIVGVDPGSADVSEWLEPAKSAGQQCSIELESRLPALDTWRTTADLDLVRQALGLTRLNAIGRGEGARVLTVFAERFPNRVGRMVLDGLPDSAPDILAGLEGVAAGAEGTWQAFAADCRNRGCELGPDPHQALPALLDQVRVQSLFARGIRIGPGAALRAVLVGLVDRRAWPALAGAIAKARQGDGSGLAALLAPVLLGQNPTFDSELVIGCNDTKARLTVEQVGRAAQEWVRKYPMFGGLTAQRLTLCVGWPVATQPVQAVTAPNAPPIVVLGAANDPVTPLEGTDRAAHQLASGVLVTWQGGGHGALGVSGCATDLARTFLADGTVPRDGTACPP